MQTLNLKQLEAFCAVVERGSFTAAAEALYLSQPTLSRQIRDMDKDELDKLKTSVIQSVKNSGAETLANYIQTIYYQIYKTVPPKKSPILHLSGLLSQNGFRHK